MARVRVYDSILWSKLLNCTEKRTPSHVLSDNGLFLRQLHQHVTIFNTGGKFKFYVVTHSYSSRLFLCALGTTHAHAHLTALQAPMMQMTLATHAHTHAHFTHAHTNTYLYTSLRRSVCFLGCAASCGSRRKMVYSCTPWLTCKRGNKVEVNNC